jgi:hypothetical protein
VVEGRVASGFVAAVVVVVVVEVVVVDGMDVLVDVVVLGNKFVLF